MTYQVVEMPELNFLPRATYREKVGVKTKPIDWNEYILHKCSLLNTPEVHSHFNMPVDGPTGSGKSSDTMERGKRITDRINQINTLTEKERKSLFEMELEDVPEFFSSVKIPNDSSRIPFTVEDNVIVSAFEFQGKLASIVRWRCDNIKDDVHQTLQRDFKAQYGEAWDKIPSVNYPAGSVFVLEEAQSALSVAASAVKMETKELLMVIRSMQINLILNTPWFKTVADLMYDLGTFRINIHRKTKDGQRPLMRFWGNYRDNYDVFWADPRKLRFVGGRFDKKMGVVITKNDPGVWFIGLRASPELWKEYESNTKTQYQERKIIQSIDRVLKISAQRKHSFGSEMQLKRGLGKNKGKNGEKGSDEDQDEKSE